MVKRVSNEIKHQRKPDWFKVRIPAGEQVSRMGRLLRQGGMHSICEEGLCPNREECWSAGTASFLILGDICTRNCKYCHVKSGRPTEYDLAEPQRLRELVRELKLRYVVITSVTRDDLKDGGAFIYTECVRLLKEDGVRVELLIPDFRYNDEALRSVIDSKPYVLGHNIETVRRIYPLVRRIGTYDKSMRLLSVISRSQVPSKSALMVGLGESMDEIVETLRDLREAGCERLAVGQYLQPTRAHVKVEKYYHPDDFFHIKEQALQLGFRFVEAGPLVRSSYHAERHVEAAQ